jgi:hypothetical protein
LLTIACRLVTTSNDQQINHKKTRRQAMVNKSILKGQTTNNGQQINPKRTRRQAMVNKSIIKGQDDKQ